MIQPNIRHCPRRYNTTANKNIPCLYMELTSTRVCGGQGQQQITNEQENIWYIR